MHTSNGSHAPAKVVKVCQFRPLTRKGSSSSMSSRASSSATPSRCSSPLSAITSNGLITPISSRPNSPLGNRTTFHNNRRTNSSSSTFTSLIAPLSPALSSTSESSSMDILESLRIPPQQSTVTWDCATAVVSNQKVQTSYEKPSYSPTTQFDSHNGEPLPGTGNVISYGKLLTKTVTMTVTTTIASTEILHPHEEGYQASLERQRAQEEERERQRTACSSPLAKRIKKEAAYDEDNSIRDNTMTTWPSGDSSVMEHEAFHNEHHNSAHAIASPAHH